jgi:ABC-2 type transport system ATP-binding protein
VSVLELKEATRRFGDVVALNRVTLELDGGVTALVGPNGSGKSTFMKLATGHVQPTAGTIRAFGQTVWDNPAVMAKVGYVPEQDAFYETMTGPEFVASLAVLNGMTASDARAAAEEELTALGMTDGWAQPIRTYSKGMRQRVKLAQALVHEPELLFMDEPMLGCDPIARRRIQDRILQLERQGCTVIVSSHILPEMERLTRDIAILKGGRLWARGRANEVRDALSNVPSRLRVHTLDPRALAAGLASWPDVVGLQVAEGHVDVETPGLRSMLERLHGRLPAAWKVRGHETLDADLDSLFSYVGGGA